MPVGNRIMAITAMLYGLVVGATALLTEGQVGKVAIIGAIVVAVVAIATRPAAGAGRQRNRNRRRYSG